VRSQIAVVLIVAALSAGAGIGYFGGNANEHTVTSVSTVLTTSTSVTTFLSTVVQTNGGGGVPIPITNVETGNVSIGGSPFTVAVNPNASRIYVAGDSNVLTVVDAVSHAIVARVVLPSSSNSGIAIDYKTSTVYVLVQGGIAVINGTSNKVTGVIPVNFGYRSIAFDSSTDTIYGSAETLGNSSLVGVDSHTGKVTANVSIGYWASDVLVNPHLNLIYAIGCAQSFVCDSIISVVNGTSAKLMNETTLGSPYYSTATIDEKTGLVYVSGEAQLAILNPYGTVIHNYYPDTCGPFIAMTDDPALNQVIVAPQNYNFILVYNGWFGNLLNMYSLPDAPQYAVFNPVTNETYVVVSNSLLSFKGVASVGHVDDTLIGAGQFCLPV